jgi:hypothetical protein
LVREAFCSQIIIHIVEEREASARNQKERERLRSKRAAVWYHFHSLILQFIHRSRLKEEEEDRKRLLKLERKKAGETIRKKTHHDCDSVQVHRGEQLGTPERDGGGRRKQQR